MGTCVPYDLIKPFCVSLNNVYGAKGKPIAFLATGIPGWVVIVAPEVVA